MYKSRAIKLGFNFISRKFSTNSHVNTYGGILQTNAMQCNTITITIIIIIITTAAIAYQNHIQFGK